MKTPSLRHLLAAAFAAVLATSASAQIISTFNFDAVPNGATASLFNTSKVSFHQAHYVPFLDSFGDPIAGSDHWEIDVVNDTLFPVTAEDPLDYGRGVAPSGTNALQALFQPVLLSFDGTYNLQSFSFTLDNDTFGAVAPVAFITSTGTVLELSIDPSVAGLSFSTTDVFGINGIVLPGGAFYDNIAINALPVGVPLGAVPEPSTYGLLAALLALGGAAWRRRKHA